MNKAMAVAVLGAVLVGVAGGTGGCGSMGKGKEGVTQVSVEKAPSALIEGVNRDYPGSTITRIERQRADHRTSYIVYLTTAGKEHRIVRYDAKGNRLGSK